MATEDKILKVLEENPSGLSISDLARKTGLHRNTISPNVSKLLKKGKLKYTMVGQAKVYYLSHDHGLHGGIKMEKGENIQVGIGVSKLDNPYEAGKDAVEQAIAECGTENPNFSIVFSSSHYDPYKIAGGVQTKLEGNHWIGCTSDRELNSKTGYEERSVEVICINTRYMHFHTEVVENYRENPFEKGKQAIRRVTEEAESNRLVDPYIQYVRMKKKNYTDIVRNPPYFMLSFIGGIMYDKANNPIPGMELEFLEGIFSEIGYNIPIVGASASSDFDDISQNKGINYVFCNNQIYQNAAVLTFVISDLYFSYGLEHGYQSTSNLVFINKVSNNGRIIEELNQKPAVQEYVDLLGINKNEFLDDPFKYLFTNSFGIIDSIGNTYIKSIGVFPGSVNSFFSLSKITENSAANIVSFNQDTVISAMSNSIKQCIKDNENKRIALALIFPCSSRRVILQDNTDLAIQKTKDFLGETPFFGFYSFGEIGGRRDKPIHFNNQTVTSLVIFDRLLTQ